MLNIETLSLKNFRNYLQQEVCFHPHLNFVIGDNAQGKTNLLESIYFLSVNRSFRTSRDHELIRWNSGFFFIKGLFSKGDFQYDVRASYPHNSRLKIMVNGAAAVRYEHISQLPVVVFSPDDLAIIRDGPAVRRRFINLEASRLDQLYLNRLRDYQRVMMQRNIILKEEKNRSQANNLLAPWDQSLVEYGSAIIKTRVKLIDKIGEEAQFFFDKLTASREKLSLHYLSNLYRTKDLDCLEEIFFDDLERKRDRELKVGTTLSGPHLDDLKIAIDGYDTRHYSSQGQKRAAALALKMAVVNLFKEKCLADPIVILDDVFSELDSARKRQLFLFLQSKTGQCFISTALKHDELAEEIGDDHKTFLVQRGVVDSETGRPAY